MLLSLCLPDDGLFNEVVVEIERSQEQKPFLGGYRHRLTGAEYHHAAVQTLRNKRPDRGVLVYSQSTQVIHSPQKLFYRQTERQIDR